MKLLLIILVAIVMLVIIMMIIGRMLPVKHVASQSRSFRSTPDDVWRVVTDINEWKAWRFDLKNFSVTGPDSFRADDVDYVIATPVPGKTFTTTIVTKDLPYGGSWVYTIEPDGHGCKLTVVEMGEVYNPLFRFLSKYFFGHDGSLKNYMSALSKRIQ